LFGLVHEGLARYARKHHGAAGARFAAACLWAGAAARYAAALVTPGAAGHRRRIRYRSALKGRALLNTRSSLVGFPGPRNWANPNHSVRFGARGWHCFAPGFWEVVTGKRRRRDGAVMRSGRVAVGA